MITSGTSWRLVHSYAIVKIFLILLFQGPSECMQGTSWRLLYSDAIQDHVIVGPLLKSITSLADKDCEDACFMHVPDLCYMFNYHPQSKKCELFHKDRASEYKVEMRSGYLFKTQMVRWETLYGYILSSLFIHCILKKLGINFSFLFSISLFNTLISFSFSVNVNPFIAVSNKPLSQWRQVLLAWRTESHSLPMQART